LANDTAVKRAVRALLFAVNAARLQAAAFYDAIDRRDDMVRRVVDGDLEQFAMPIGSHAILSQRIATV